MKQLIVNADDFGMADSINEGIAKAFKEGIVTAINVLPTGDAYRNACGMMAGLGIKEIGAHLALTETRPLSDPLEIPSLVDKDGAFYRSHNIFLPRYFAKAVAREHIYAELRKQLDALTRLGVPITNLSSHENIHMVPGLLDIFIELADGYDIHSIRCPQPEKAANKFSVIKFARSLVLDLFGISIKKALDKKGIIYADHFLGFLDSGRLSETVLIRMLDSLEDGATELVSHPSFLSPEVLERYRFHMNGEYEIYALTSPDVKKAIKDRDIRLITYGEYVSGRKL